MWRARHSRRRRRNLLDVGGGGLFSPLAVLAQLVFFLISNVSLSLSLPRTSTYKSRRELHIIGRGLVQNNRRQLLQRGKFWPKTAPSCCLNSEHETRLLPSQRRPHARKRPPANARQVGEFLAARKANRAGGNVEEEDTQVCETLANFSSKFLRRRRRRRQLSLCIQIGSRGAANNPQSAILIDFSHFYQLAANEKIMRRVSFAFSIVCLRRRLM